MLLGTLAFLLVALIVVAMLLRRAGVDPKKWTEQHDRDKPPGEEP
jgi:hypothetical protein